MVGFCHFLGFIRTTVLTEMTTQVSNRWLNAFRTFTSLCLRLTTSPRTTDWTLCHPTEWPGTTSRPRHSSEIKLTCRWKASSLEFLSSSGTWQGGEVRITQPRGSSPRMCLLWPEISYPVMRSSGDPESIWDSSQDLYADECMTLL